MAAYFPRGTHISRVGSVAFANGRVSHGNTYVPRTLLALELFRTCICPFRFDRLKIKSSRDEWRYTGEKKVSLSLCCHVCSSRSIGKFRCVSSYRVMSFECESRSRSSVYDTRSKIINISKSTNAIRDSPRLITANVASKITAKLTGWRFLNFSLDFILFTTLPFIRAALLWKI